MSCWSPTRAYATQGLTKNAETGLVAGGCELTVFDDVEADPPSHVIERAVALCRDKGIELVASIGGGSALDTAKLVAYLAKTPDRLDDIYGVGLAKGERLPLLLVPTTAGTGSEVTPIAIVTTPTTEKKGVVSPRLLPDWAILDPELTLGSARARHGGDRHRRHGACDRSLYKQAQEEPDVGSAGAAGACLAVGQCPHGLRRRLESRSAIADAAGFDAGRHGIRQFAGRRGSCACLSDRRDIPRAAWFVECPGPDAGAAVQFAGSGRALCRTGADRRSQDRRE